uniref:ATP synthase subunit a n=1 Tax=Compsopogon caeruleus TaxID=31354 RepID=A0A1Z1XBJ3_9RHOD|nr:ATP synthase F0 subunit 6 [Compsopogon caeruleus]ARX96177.1 ATP synthase F0 subunit 6 [Compsopogon caeruleus]
MLNSPFSILSPLEQFEIVLYLFFDNILGYNILFSNTTLFLVITGMLSIALYTFSFFEKLLIPTRWQYFAEIIYKVSASIVSENLGKKGERYFPLVFVLFIILLISNLIGMIPYTFTVTSHIAFTFGLSLSLFIGINIIGLYQHGFNFLCVFLPKGVPLPIIPLIVAIEIVSYFIKVFTLAIRLFANITSGHTLLKIIASFGWSIAHLSGIYSIFQLVPLLVLFILTGLELGIAVLQAYVFTLLTCIYLNDVLDMH